MHTVVVSTFCCVVLPFSSKQVIVLHITPAVHVDTMSCSIQKLPLLLVACEDGWLYMFSIKPLASGNECTLLRQHRSVYVCMTCMCSITALVKYYLNVMSCAVSSGNVHFLMLTPCHGMHP